MKLRSLNIARRAFVCFGLITLLLISLAGFSYVQIDHLRSAEQDIEQNSLPSVQVIDDIQIALLHARLESIRMLSSTTREVHDKSQSLVEDAIQALQSKTAFYREHLISGQQDEIQFAKTSQAMDVYIDGLKQVLALDISDHDQAVVFANTEQAQRANVYQEQLTILREQNARQAVESGEEATAVYTHSVSVLISVLVVAFILTIVLASLFTRSIVSPINSSLELAENIASGDLTHDLEVTGSDEASRLMQALNLMQKNLRSTISEISGASAQLSTAAVEMTSITESADRTLQQQNSEIEQAATAVTEMSAAVEEVARNANSTSEAAMQSSLSADLGNQKVTETLTAMRGLTELVEVSSGQVKELAGQAQDISKVLSVIRAIAEQTNLLALNAAIEAARAGEQGRGFAVVADEVRALAHRTQTSTQEIEQMISTIQAGSSAAVELMHKSTSEVYTTRDTAEQAGHSLRQIIDSVLEINDRNIQIATASEEQAHVARDVDRSLISIRDLAIQSTEGTRQTLTASNELSRLAVNLNDLVLRFRT
ncbi:methyl-accepting chemotaxis protein [Pseudomonas fluorescens]|jgi:methyl-accepting chemotaxis protein|uniref:Methyl-accepting chemotaxis protein n=2 Tax=Pseudomonas fluorescens TaxID=294 RepID=A0A2N1E5F2_PSEFL|nr:MULTISPECIES: methyl-accepting chemotaxis protein [Pseudomonas]MBD8097345.1 methyl-accepting chemotaxis protein [Pseudomonas fluorescens]MBD8773318.1 methyl-accepting chemotaxis protein [Pseudomonas fluorescens]MBD8777651.1 methyl-accepting chemotaxis protein [Pseudomonas fluorescens]MBD8794253.1 methyl-accepting chemotaxis protein [Pseudomonas fluorescens]PKH19949.1 methyl-accepting chemotaxis protein [Pseudomonas fluorescens]